MPQSETDAPSLDPIGIITTGTWDSVLFTTYALSLSFFEAHILRNGLKRNGCEEIWVVADESKYAQALAERQARGAGQDYRIVPVALTGGVFHPKCVYLHSRAYDALLVGSGNLTFGGYGRNVEVVEAFRSDQHPHLFGEFAAFLDALAGRKDFFNPDPLWLKRFADLARTAEARHANMPADIGLMHNVTASAFDQIAAKAAAEGGGTSLRVLSPFFDEDANAVSALVQQTGCTSVSIGLLPDESDESPFPFSRGIKGVKVIPSKVDVPDSERGLHAKWFECDLKSGRRLVTTGSFNATYQSLCTSGNIELNVVRLENGAIPGRLGWQRVSAPKKQTVPDKSAPGIGSRVIVYATLAEGGRLHGIMLSTRDITGEWTGTLMRADGTSVTLTISVDTKGMFMARVTNREAFELQSGLQLQMAKGVLEGRCWVHNEWLLDVTRVKHVPMGAIQRLLQGDAEEEDHVDFIEFLSSSLHEVMPTSSNVRGSHSNATKPAETVPNRSVVVSTLQPGEGSASAAGRELEIDRVDQMQRLIQRLFGHFEKSIHAKSKAKADVSDSPTTSEDEDAPESDAEEERTKRKRKTQQAYERFRQAVHDMFETQTNEGSRRVLSELWLMAELQYLLRDGTQKEAAQAFCRGWLLKTTRVTKMARNPEKLDRYVLTIAAILGAKAAAPGAERERLVGLHEALENFGATDLPVEELNLLLDQPNRFAGVRDSDAISNVEGLNAVLTSQTRRGEIAVIQDALARQIPFPSGLAILTTGSGREMRDAHMRGESVRISLWRQGRNACPNPLCGMSLGSGDLGELERLRITKCVQCENFIVNA